jgi:hypothetical protein
VLLNTDGDSASNMNYQCDLASAYASQLINYMLCLCNRDTDVNVPMAPELGLFLDECFYTGYNKKFKNTHDEVSQKGFEKEIADFKREVIYSHIQLTEVKDGTMVMWLHLLNDRNYPDFVTAREAAPAKID